MAKIKKAPPKKKTVAKKPKKEKKEKKDWRDETKNVESYEAQRQGH